MKKLSAAQWLRLQPERKPEPESFPLSRQHGDDIVVVSVSNKGARLVARAA